MTCSSLGQNLKTSTYVWESAFAVFISISGLVLFALLIGNMQVNACTNHFVLTLHALKLNIVHSKLENFSVCREIGSEI